jgi:hypothetical protein
MNDDYLWDRGGPTDAEVERLETLLAPLGHDGAHPLRHSTSVARRRWRTLGALAAAAALVLVAGGWWWLTHRRLETPGWTVTTTAGAPTIESRRIDTGGELRAGDWLETHNSGKASIDVGSIGVVSVEPDTRIGLVSARTGDYRLHLARGTMHATIWAPPGQFFVQTPSSVAIDLGCAYTLTVDEAGAGLVRVTLGWVGFGWRDREAFIPAGAMCRTRPGVGPGTPRYEDATDAFHAAIDIVDFGPLDERPAALARALALARDRDAMTLWHLLTSVEARDRDRVFDALAAFVPPPPTVTRDGIRSGRRDMLDAWWDALGLGTASWWRTWKQPWQDDTQGGR